MLKAKRANKGIGTQLRDSSLKEELLIYLSSNLATRYDLIRRSYLWGRLWLHLINKEDRKEAERVYEEYFERLDREGKLFYTDILEGYPIARSYKLIDDNIHIWEEMSSYLLFGNSKYEDIFSKEEKEEACNMASEDRLSRLSLSL